MGHRVVFLGLDGLSETNYAMIKSRGLLSSLRLLEGRGSVKGRASMVPPLTPPMWTSMTSGVNPGKHGVYFFVLTDGRGRRIRLHNAADVMYPRIHYALSFNRLESLVANLPFSSWPYIPFRGVLVSDWLAPKPFGSPSWVDEIVRSAAETVEREYDLEKEFVCKLVSHDLVVAEALEKILARDKGLSRYSFVFVMFSFIDSLMHKYPEEVFSPSHRCVKDLYDAVDDIFKSMLEESLDDSLVILAGDHGIDRVDYRVTVSRILYEAGLVEATYASLAESQPVSRISYGGGGVLTRVINMLLRNPYTGKPLTRLGRLLLRLAPSYRYKLMAVERPVPDEEKSKIIIPKVWHYGLYVNESLVDDIDKVVAEAEKALRSYEERTGHRFIHTFARGRGGLFRGPYTWRAPHIIVAPRQGYSFASLNLYAPPIERDWKRLGDHHPDNLHIIVPPAGDPTLAEAARQVRDPWDYAILAYMALGIPLPVDNDSSLPRRLGFRAKTANYRTRYLLLLRLHTRASRPGAGSSMPRSGERTGGKVAP